MASFVMLEYRETNAISLEVAELIKNLTENLSHKELSALVETFNRIDLLTTPRSFRYTGFHLADYIFNHPKMDKKCSADARLDELHALLINYIDTTLCGLHVTNEEWAAFSKAAREIAPVMQDLELENETLTMSRFAEDICNNTCTYLSSMNQSNLVPKLEIAEKLLDLIAKAPFLSACEQDPRIETKLLEEAKLTMAS